MKKTYFFLLLFIVSVSLTFSQQRIWSREHINFSEDLLGLTLPMAIDKNDHVFLASRFAVNDNNTLHRRILLSKYNREGQKLWEKIYKSAADKENTFQHVGSLRTDSEGSVYIGLSSQAENENRWRFLLVKYDAAGNFVWDRTHEGSGNINLLTAISIDANDFIYVTGEVHDPSSATALLKYSKNGDLLWSKKYEYTSNPFDVHIDDAGNVCLTGFADDPNPNLPFDTFILTLKYSPNGDLLWEKLRKAGPQSNQGVKLRTDKDHNVYVMYHQDDGIGVITESEGGIIKYDAQGNEEWIIQGIKLENMVMDSAANIYVGNSQSLIKFNTSGQKVWEKMYDANSEYLTSSLWFPPFESMVHFPETETILMSLTTSGNQQFTKTFAFRTETGDIAWSDIFEMPDRRNRGLVKADSAFYVLGADGNYKTFSLIRYSLKNEQVQVPGNKPFAIFPNPTDGTVLVQGAPKSYDMLITDEHGRIVKQGTVPAGNSTVSFSAFAPGMYILQLTNGEDKVVKKIIRNR